MSAPSTGGYAPGHSQRKKTEKKILPAEFLDGDGRLDTEAQVVHAIRHSSPRRVLHALHAALGFGFGGLRMTRRIQLRSRCRAASRCRMTSMRRSWPRRKDRHTSQPLRLAQGLPDLVAPPPAGLVRGGGAVLKCPRPALDPRGRPMLMSQDLPLGQLLQLGDAHLVGQPFAAMRGEQKLFFAASRRELSLPGSQSPASASRPSRSATCNANRDRETPGDLRAQLSHLEVEALQSGGRLLPLLSEDGRPRASRTPCPVRPCQDIPSPPSPSLLSRNFEIPKT